MKSEVNIQTSKSVVTLRRVVVNVLTLIEEE